jgi:hypothetical protein
MDNQEWTSKRHRTKTNKTKDTTEKTKNISNMDHTKNQWMNTSSSEEWASPDSYKTPTCYA